MRRLVLAALIAIAPVAAHDEPVIVLVEFSTAERLLRQDWSGSVRLELAELKRLVKVGGGADSLVGENGWDIVYGRQGAEGVRAARPYLRKGVAIHLIADDDAVLHFTTAAGDFEVPFRELAGGDRVTRLDGNVTLQVVPPERANFAPAAAPAGGGRAARPSAPTAGNLDLAPISPADRMSEFPALAALGDQLVAAWVEWRGDHDMLRIAVHDGTWRESAELTVPGAIDVYQPELVTSGEQVWCLWPTRIGDNVDLYAAAVYPELGAPRRLTEAPWADFHVRAAPLPGGSIALTWMSWREGDGNVYYAELADGVLGPTERISPSDQTDWDPDLAVAAGGTVAVVWDSYENGNYDVYLRRRVGGEWGPVTLVTGAPEAEFHASIAAAGERLWIAYDVAPQSWGKDYGRSYRHPDPAVAKGLHDRRTLGLRAVEGDRVLELPGAFDRFGPPMDQFAELPRLAVDGGGALWMAFRHWSVRSPTEVYEEFAAPLGSDGFALPLRLAGATGRNTQHPALARTADGRLHLLIAGDGRAADMRLQQAESLNYRVYHSALPPADAAQPELVAAAVPAPAPELDTMPRQVTWTVGGATYTLAYGDCHRHTDIRGHGGVDASVMDSYRYAIDAARLDFVATTDHNEVMGGTWPDGLRPYQWWWTQKAAELHHFPPRFTALFAYEHSMVAPGGHRNVIFPTRRGAEALRGIDRRRAEDNFPPDLWRFLSGIEPALDVPHTFAEQSQPRGDFDWPNPPQEPLLEIYQGARSSYEVVAAPVGERRGASQNEQPGNFARDALAKGNRYGFVAFSDHGSTHLSYAGVWATELSRQGIWQAMRDRRTFASSDDIIVQASCAGRPLGEALRVDGAPTIEVSVAARNELRQVSLIRNGEAVYTTDPDGRTASFTWQDAQRPAGEAYYYVRVIQEDVEQPEGDPEMAWGSPVFVLE